MLSGVLNFSIWKLDWILCRDKRRRGHAQTDTSDGKLLVHKCQQCGVIEGKSRQRCERQAYPCLCLCLGTLCLSHGMFRVGGALSVRKRTLVESGRDPPRCHFVVIISSAPFDEVTATSHWMLTPLGLCTLSLLERCKDISCQHNALAIYVSKIILPSLNRVWETFGMACVHEHWNMSFIIVSVVYLACDALGWFVVDSSLANVYPTLYCCVVSWQSVIFIPVLYVTKLSLGLNNLLHVGVSEV